MAIEFKSINIRRNWEGKLTGRLEVEGDFGSSALRLTADLCESIINICADNIVAAASEIANDMKSEAAKIPSAFISGQVIENGADE